MGDNNNLVTKNELINILYKKNIDFKINNQKIIEILNKDKEITKEDLSNSIDEMVKLEEMDGILHCITDEFTHSKTLDICYFKVDTDKYLCIYTDSSLDIVDEAKKIIEQIDFITKNNLNNNKMTDALEYMKNEYCNPMVYNIKMKRTPSEAFKQDYDYIKILKDNQNCNNISIGDIIECKKFLLNNDQISFLTIDNQITLRLIILLGIVNLFFNYSDYYKGPFQKIINENIDEIKNNIVFINSNKSKVDKKEKYSFNKEYRFDLYEYLDGINNANNFYYDLKHISIPKYATESYGNLIEILKCICFDYCIKNSNYETAQRLYEMNLPIFMYLNNIININENPENKANTIVFNILSDSKVENIQQIDSFAINSLYKNEINAFTKRNIKALLIFYIDLYYYFRHYKEYDKAETVYDILLYFRNSFGIENFFVKYNYIKMIEEINNSKVDTDNQEEIDNAIENITKKIGEKGIVDNFDIEEVEKKYANIKFESFYQNAEKVKRYIATGDKIIQTFGSDNVNGYDFSCAVIEWCKAVELEVAQKLIKPISDLETRKNIEDKANNNKMNIEIIKKDGKFQLDVKHPTIGQFTSFEKYHIRDFVYEEYYRKIYKLDRITYYNLCELLKRIVSNRNDSAHKDKAIELSKANECQEEILASKKILEILSTLEEKNI